MRTLHGFAWVAMAAAVVGVTVGCAGPAAEFKAPTSMPAEEDSAAFLDRVSSQQVVSESDAFRGILLMMERKDTAKTFKQRLQALRAKNVVAESWVCDAGRSITRGKLAYMICQACGIKGGIILRLAGPSQRYCLRELQYMDMMGEGTIFTPVSGMEFIAVLTRGDTYFHTGKVLDRVGETEE